VNSALERVQKCIDDPEFVSEQQRLAILDEGNFFLLARPGSGKTRTVAIRVALAASRSNGRAVAATSYTNVAISQIRATVRDLGIVIGDQHFTGTLHEFLISYVLSPFAGRLGIRQPFHLIRDDWNGWGDVIFRGNARRRLSISRFHYGADGAFTVAQGSTRTLGLTPAEAAAEGEALARELKAAARARGLISPSDALYYALALLEGEPLVRAAIAGRFNELIVDEAQDTSDVQLRCLELLHETGQLASLVLVGDLDQSIYSFQGAAPGLCRALVATRSLRELPMTENFRSSQAICNVTCRFCGREEPDTAVGPNRDCTIPPEVLIYPAADPAAAVERFRTRLSKYALGTERAVVLTRGWSLASTIDGLKNVEVGVAVAAVGRLAAAVHNGRTIEREQLHAVEQLLAEIAWGLPAPPQDEETRWKLRKAIMQLTAALPTLDRDLASWIGDARAAVTRTLDGFVDTPKHKPQHRLRSKAGFDGVKATEVFVARTDELQARTVHAVKGESLDAVLLVAERKKKGLPVQSELWSTPLIGGEVGENEAEELRIAYVALTRAERYCAVALPDDTSPELIAAYLNVGFCNAQQE